MGGQRLEEGGLSGVLLTQRDGYIIMSGDLHVDQISLDTMKRSFRCLLHWKPHARKPIHCVFVSVSDSTHSVFGLRVSN